MKKQVKDLKVSTECKKLLNDIKKLKNPIVLKDLVKVAIFTRDYHLGKECESPVPATEGLTSQEAQRARRLFERVDALEDKKEISLVCAAAITQRKLARQARQE